MRNETASDVAAELNLDEKTVRRWAAANCPHERTKDGRLLFNIVEVRAWQVATGHTGAARRPTAAEEARRKAPPIYPADLFSITHEDLRRWFDRGPLADGVGRLSVQQGLELADGLAAACGLWLALKHDPAAKDQHEAPPAFWQAIRAAHTAEEDAEIPPLLVRLAAAYLEKTLGREWLDSLNPTDRAAMETHKAPARKTASAKGKGKRGAAHE